MHPCCEPFAAPDPADDTRRTGDWIARVLRSYVLMPEPSVDLTDSVEASRFLWDLVIPGIAHEAFVEG